MSDAHASHGREIERVWVLREMPVIPHNAEIWEIEQGYLAAADAHEHARADDGDSPAPLTGRLRRVEDSSGASRYFHTVKTGSGLVRIEHERELSRAEFDAAWPHTEGSRLTKTRSRVRCSGEGGETLVWEIDRFHALPLVMAEVELTSETQRAPFPSWLAPLIVKEVTLDARYRNSSLVFKGMPREA